MIVQIIRTMNDGVDNEGTRTYYYVPTTDALLRLPRLYYTLVEQ